MKNIITDREVEVFLILLEEALAAEDLITLPSSVSEEELRSIKDSISALIVNEEPEG